MDVKSLSSNHSLDLLKPKGQEVKNGTGTGNSTGTAHEKIKEQQNQLELKKAKQVTKEDLESNIEGVNKFLDLNLTAIKFQVHEDLDRLYVEVVDRHTDEVVRQIPPKEFLDMISTMLEHVGLLVDKRI